MLGRTGDLALGRGQVAGHLIRQPIRRPLVVAEHRRVELELHELADPAQGPLWVGHQVLVARLHVVAYPAPVAAGDQDAALPPLCQHADRRRFLDRPRLAREGRVAPVPDQVDEAGLGQEAVDLEHRLDVVRRLVAPAPLALLLGVELVKGAHQLACPRLREPTEPAAKLPPGQPEVAEAPVCDDQLGGALHRGVVAAALRDQVRDEVGLGRDRELRVGVEHEAQQRRPGAADSDHERSRRPWPFGGGGFRLSPAQRSWQLYAQWQLHADARSALAAASAPTWYPSSASSSPASASNSRRSSSLIMDRQR